MFRYLIASVFLAALATAMPTYSDCDTFRTRIHLTLNDTSEKSTKATINVCEEQNLIHMEIAETDFFGHTEAIDDFNSGFSAEATPDVCMISKLRFSNIKDRVKDLRAQDDHKVQGEGNFNLYPVTDSDVAAMGDNIVNFCEGKEMYKLSEDSYTEVANYEDPNAMERTIFAFFGPTCYYSFCRWVCFTTTVTVPTGTTITFLWFFG